MLLPPKVTPKGVYAGNYAVGRGPVAAPVAIVLHQFCGTLEQLDAMMCRVMPLGSAHVSFHYAIDGASIHSYVNPTDTAFAFNGVETPPTLPAGAGTPDQKTINIAVLSCMEQIYGSTACPENVTPYSQATLDSIAGLSAWLSQTYGITPSASTIVTETGGLPYFDTTTLISNTTAIIAATAAPTPDCAYIAGNAALPFSVIVCQNGERRLIPSTALGGGGGGPTTNTLSVAGTTLTSTVNGVSASVDIGPAVQSVFNNPVNTTAIFSNPAVISAIRASIFDVDVKDLAGNHLFWGSSVNV